MLAKPKRGDTKNSKDASQAIDREVKDLVEEFHGTGEHIAIATPGLGFVSDDDALVQSTERQDHAYLCKVAEQTADEVQFYLDG